MPQFEVLPLEEADEDIGLGGIGYFSFAAPNDSFQEALAEARSFGARDLPICGALLSIDTQPSSSPQRRASGRARVLYRI